MTAFLNFGVAFASTLGALSLLLFKAPDITSVCVTAGLFILFALAGFFLYRNLKPFRIFKFMAAALSLVSAAFSVTFASGLITYSEILEKNYYPLVLLVTVSVCVLTALSDKNAAKSVNFVCCILTAFLLVIILLLSLIDTDFSMPQITAPNVEIVILPAALCFLDIILLSSFCTSKTPLPYVAGGLSAFGLFAAAVIIALCVLTNSVYYSFDAPILKLWQSTYITSFVNRFEVVSLCSVYLLCTVKSGLLLSCTVSQTGKKYSSIVALLLLFVSALLSFLKIY